MRTDRGNYQSAFDGDEWTLLWPYEWDYVVRQVSLYTAYGTFSDDYCLRPGTEGGVASGGRDQGGPGAYNPDPTNDINPPTEHGPARPTPTGNCRVR
jgi:hypothetical protein